jgi:NADH-quinone oxidoreductase subunit J
MDITSIFFYIFSAVMLFAAFKVITSRNPVHSALYLVLCFFQASAIWMLLQAEFLSITLILVYVGAVMVLFLFVIMLMSLNAETEPQKNRWMKMAGVIAGGSLMLVVVAALRETELKDQFAQMKVGDIGLIQNLGKVLFKDYVLPFEISSVLFLSAMVGAVVIGKKD